MIHTISVTGNLCTFSKALNFPILFTFFVVSNTAIFFYCDLILFVSFNECKLVQVSILITHNHITISIQVNYTITNFTTSNIIVSKFFYSC